MAQLSWGTIRTPHDVNRGLSGEIARWGNDHSGIIVDFSFASGRSDKQIGAVLHTDFSFTRQNLKFATALIYAFMACLTHVSYDPRSDGLACIDKENACDDGRHAEHFLHRQALFKQESGENYRNRKA